MSAPEGTRSKLDGVLECYEPISRAPNMHDLEKLSAKTGISLQALLEQEAQKHYKAFDSASGNVYLIKNPVAWRQTEQGIERPAPIFQFTMADARKFGRGAPKAKGGASDDLF